MKIEKFEDIVAWQEARMLTKGIYRSIRKNGRFDNDLKFKSQISSSAVSVMSNIAEGFSKSSNKDFVRYLFIAKGSLSEVQSQLYVALDQEYIDEKAFKQYYGQADKTARLISRFITYLKQNVRKVN